MKVYIVHLRYGNQFWEYIDCVGEIHRKNNYLHLVRCPDGSGKMFEDYGELNRFLVGKKWKYAI